jgi:TetR/AcrR family transcriptional regulator, transcriptional repressor for nem operon
MKVSREQMAHNRRRILQAASRLFRAKGFEAVSVADVMKAAGLTHGGFYGHFSSKDDLVAHALADALAADPSKGSDLQTFIDGYLSPRHRDNPAKGCPMAGLAAETRHQRSAAHTAMTEGLRSHIERFAKAFPGRPAERRRAAIGSWSAMVGAMILARAADDPDLSNEILEQTRSWIST